MLATCMHILEAPEEYLTKRSTSCVLDGKLLWVYVFSKEVADLRKSLNVCNVYAYSGRPRRVPHQAWYFWCSGLNTFMGPYICKLVYRLVKISIWATYHMHILECPEKYHTKLGTFCVWGGTPHGLRYICETVSRCVKSIPFQQPICTCWTAQ
jgi:hypothetical protein